jgi:hypothetical protein
VVGLPCETPLIGEVGDVWYCPECARKYYYILITVDDIPAAEAWVTNEIG